MYQIESHKLWMDTKAIYQEYKNEDKRKYKTLYGKYFHDTENYLVWSIPFKVISCVHDIFIIISRYSKVTTYFCSIINMEQYADQLRKDPTIRELTKLCFYIEENIGQYNTIDKDMEEPYNIKV